MAILTTDDPVLIRRLFELHRERLEERLVHEQRTLATLEAFLLETAATRRSGP